MRTLLLAGMMTGALAIAATPATAGQTVVHGPTSVTVSGPGTIVRHGGAMQSGMIHGGMIHGAMPMRQPMWSQRVDGRWIGGVQAPGGWAAYRAPQAGFILPGYWLQPQFYVSDWAWYGLLAPAAGFGWSRYYDDAVLTDRYGKVIESRAGYDWDRYGPYAADAGYADRYDSRRGDGGRTLAGAAIGGVTGGLLGSAIAGRGDRTAGAILGAGVGAIAGAVIADGARPRDERVVAPGYSYGMRTPAMTGSERKLAREAAKQRRKLDKMARKAGYANYDAYLRAQDSRYMAGPAPRGGEPHWAMRGGPEGPAPAHGPAYGHGHGPRVESYTEPGYVRGGWYYPGATVTTVTIQPGATTTTRTYVTQQSAARRAARPATKIIKRKVVRTDCRCN